MNILKPGQSVCVHEGAAGDASSRIVGKIVQVLIYSDMSVQYKVAWWNDRTQTTDWFTAPQLDETEEAEYLKIEPIAAKRA